MTTPAEPFGIPAPLAKDHAEKRRLWALTQAVARHANIYSVATDDGVIETARTFEAYLADGTRTP